MCNDGEFWYTKLKISVEVQSNDGWASETRAKVPFLTVPSFTHKNA